MSEYSLIPLPTAPLAPLAPITSEPRYYLYKYNTDIAAYVSCEL